MPTTESPAPLLPTSGKTRRDRLIRRVTAHPRWALGVADAVWWSRLAHPDPHRWSAAGNAIRLQALARAKADPDPKALACYGLLGRRRPPQTEQLLLRCVEGRPVSMVTTEWRAWCCDRLAVHGITAWRLIWDNASWHTRQWGRTWIRRQNQGVKANNQGVRRVACLLPVKSPWLNPIEPNCIHGKRAVSEPGRLLSALEVETRLDASYGCTREAPLVRPKKVA